MVMEGERQVIDNPADALLWLDWGGRFLHGDYATYSADVARVVRAVLANSERQAAYIERLEAEIVKEDEPLEAGNG
jgi:hypothetical protein